MASIALGAINLLWFATLLACWCFDIYFSLGAFLWIFACPVMTFLGIVAGVIEFYKNRMLLGLVLNLPMLLLSVLIAYYLLSQQAGLPPQH